jgi:hypothetical protein
MPASAKASSYSLEDFASFLSFLADSGVEFAVIGGCAVGAYAHLRGREVLSGDLDVYTRQEDLYLVVERVRRTGVPIRKTPRPRNVPVAMFEWDGKEINVLSGSTGLPPPDTVLRFAREFHFRNHPGLTVLVADPYDLLANKIAVNRPRDRPHIEVLRAFIEEEIVEAFLHEQDPRKRIAPAKRYLRVTKKKTLPPDLAARLIPHARLEADCRFLAGTVPNAEQAECLAERVPASAAEEVRAILSRRRFRAPS